MGLLDNLLNSEDGRLGLGLLAAGSARSDGAGFGQRLSEAVGSVDQWKQQQAQAKRMKMQEEFQAFQMQQAMAQQADEAKRRSIFAQNFQQAIPASADGMGPTRAMGFDHNNAAIQLGQAGMGEQAMDLMAKFKPKPDDYKTVGNSLVQIGEGGVNPVFTEPKAPKEIDPNKPFMMVDGKIVPNEAYQAFDLKSGAARAPKITNNLPTQENEQSKAFGKLRGEQRAEIEKAAFNAPSVLMNLDRSEELLRGVDGGKFAGGGMQLSSAARSLGLNIDPKLGNKEAAEALAIEMALKQKPAGSGAMSDPEFDNYLRSVPSLAKTPEGRAEIARTMRAKAKRDIEIGKMARQYSKANGGIIDDGFFDQVANYQASTPIITQSDGNAVNAALNKYPPRKP